MSDEATVSRRSFFALLRGRGRDEAAEPAQAAESACADEADVEPPPPWEARQRARRAADSVPRFARVLAFDCIAGSSGLCATCVERCPVPGALVAAGGPPRVDAALCDGCGACEEACPAPRKAVVMLPRIDGRARGM